MKSKDAYLKEMKKKEREKKKVMLRDRKKNGKHKIDEHNSVF